MTAAAATAEPALSLRDIVITFERTHLEPLHLFTGFNLDVSPGTLHCLSGRSGSGKTSLLRVAVALTTPTRGTVAWGQQRVDDLDAAALSRARRGHVSYVDQGATAIDELTALDNVLLPAIPTGITVDIEDRAHELLDAFGLRPRATQRAGNLSGGERQRIALARALLLRPQILAVDEPTASLDRASADRVIAALHAAAGHGTAVLAASHDRALIAGADIDTPLD